MAPENSPQTPKAEKGTGSNSPQQSAPSSFGKTAIFAVIAAILVYAYQTQLFSLWTPSAAPGTTPFDDDVSFAFGKDPETKVDFSADVQKRDAVVDAFKYAWAAYERDAMGNDEYHPLTQTGSNLSESGGIGYMVVDVIDTMQIMGLTEEYERARDWVANKLTFDRDGNFNTFETTIRVLGGLLSAYHFSEDQIFLDKAVDLADRILPVFDTATGLPLSMTNLGKRIGVDDPNAPGLVSTAEAATLQLEFKYLSYLTDNVDYWEKAEAVMRVIDLAKIPAVVVPIYMSAETGQFQVSEIRLGSRGDSYYEYLLKQYLQTDKSERFYLKMYQEAMEAIHKNMLKQGIHNGNAFTAEMLPERRSDGQVSWRLSPKQDHLVCFLAGSLMLGATTTGATGDNVSVPPRPSELTSSAQKDWKVGYELLETCIDTYKTATGLSAEIVHFWIDEDGEKAKFNNGRDWYIKDNHAHAPSYDARYILRPETVESLFIAFRLTGNPYYREVGWKIFGAIQKFCRVETGGYASILNVDHDNTIQMDKMETFFLSETLKYLYLLFSDDTVIPLDKYVFNTEAHPIPIFTPTVKSGFL
ncbi:hypothetical protein D9619_003686 [Psilocybe cf. subviscida]|uniref:alpha-1,2-Mannosidase n=1 Tax=Psilocybe cf. subviscida TaxID=2480587 RepID=A0A8H5AWM0_9AGAR|nr:hypothetical protein D9619_003686 [Psilocybe cf. subviscida]